MRIRAIRVWTFREAGRSFTIRPEMGVISHMPRRVCEAALNAGAAEVLLALAGIDPVTDCTADPVPDSENGV